MKLFTIMICGDDAPNILGTFSSETKALSEAKNYIDTKFGFEGTVTFSVPSGPGYTGASIVEILEDGVPNDCHYLALYESELDIIKG